MTSTRAETQANYDRLSRWYDLLAGKSERRLRDAGLARLSAGPGELVLELGPGTGHALAAIGAAVGSAGLALGLDLSPGMCRRAQRTLRRPDFRLAWVCCGDAARLPLASRRIDAVFMSFALELFDAADQARVLAECGRVLRPGGRVCVVAMAEPRHPSVMSRLYAWSHRRFPRVIDCRPIAVAGTLESNGFRVTAATDHMLWGLPVSVVIAQLVDTQVALI